MTTLAVNAPRAYELGDKNHLPVIANDIIYEGAAVGDNASGYARPLVAGDPFRGFCVQKADNTGGSAGDINVEVESKGRIQLSITSLAITDVGRAVYASDDNAFALSGNGTYIGRVVRYISSGVGVVEFDASKVEDEIIVSVPVTLANITGAGDVVTTYTPGFNGRIKKMDWVQGAPVTTASKAADLNAEIGTTNVTGGVVALTSAACTPLGKTIAGSAVTAANAFTATDTISIEAANVTAFAEGAGAILLTLGR
jgi:hypothetical protein